MQTIAMSLPFLPGGKEKLMELHREVTGSGREGHRDFHQRHNVRENWYMQSTPLGDAVTLYIETDDLNRMFRGLQETTHPYDIAFFEKAKAVHGVDFTQPPAGPLPEILYENTPMSEREYAQSLCFVLPAIEGGAEQLRALTRHVTGDRKEEHEAWLSRLNFNQNWYLQHTPVGDWVLLYLETDSLPELFGGVVGVSDPYNDWVHEFSKGVHGVDFRQPATGPLPEILYESRNW